MSDSEETTTEEGSSVTVAPGPELSQEELVEKYGGKTITVNVGKTFVSEYHSLHSLAMDLKCSISDLARLAVTRLLKNPPTEAPKGSRSGRTGAPGFHIFTNYETGEIFVQEVACRTDFDGEESDWEPFNRKASNIKRVRQSAFDRAIATAVRVSRIANRGKVDASKINVQTLSDMNETYGTPVIPQL